MIDKQTQRNMVAQDLIQVLVNFLQMPLRPDHAIIQAALNEAGTKVAAINNAPEPATVPLVVPQLGAPPPAAAATTAAGAATT